MQQIPYELLQQISSSLLPRYQCRFALASKFHYKYLYTPLLAWHALKHPIEIPKHKYTQYKRGILSVIQANKKIVLYEHVKWSNITSFNLTTCEIHELDSNDEFMPMDLDNMICLFRDHKRTRILDGCYRYMHKDCIKSYFDNKSPLLRLPISIIYKIFQMLDKPSRKSMKQTGYYMRWLVSY